MNQYRSQIRARVFYGFVGRRRGGFVEIHVREELARRLIDVRKIRKHPPRLLVDAEPDELGAVVSTRLFLSVVNEFGRPEVAVFFRSSCLPIRSSAQRSVASDRQAVMAGTNGNSPCSGDAYHVLPSELVTRSLRVHRVIRERPIVSLGAYVVHAPVNEAENHERHQHATEHGHARTGFHHRAALSRSLHGRGSLRRVTHTHGPCLAPIVRKLVSIRAGTAPIPPNDVFSFLRPAASGGSSRARPSLPRKPPAEDREDGNHHDPKEPRRTARRGHAHGALRGRQTRIRIEELRSGRRGQARTRQALAPIRRLFGRRDRQEQVTSRKSGFIRRVAAALRNT